MRKKTAETIRNLTDISYQNIASDFSSTRSQIWQEFKDFKPYINDGDAVLDIGCGNGRLLEILKDFNIAYTGIDKSSHLLEIAKKNYPDREFIEGDILKLELKRNSYDIVFAIAVLNHIPTKNLQKKALKNIFHIIKPGGKLIMTNWNLWNLSFNKKGILKNIVARIFMPEKKWKEIYKVSKMQLGYRDLLTEWKSNDKKGILYYYAFTKNELNSLLKQAGFKIEKSYFSKGRWSGGNIITIAKK